VTQEATQVQFTNDCDCSYIKNELEITIYNSCICYLKVHVIIGPLVVKKVGILQKNIVLIVLWPCVTADEPSQ